MNELGQEEKSLITAWEMFPEYSYKEIARVMGILPPQVALLRNRVNRKGRNLHSRHISP